MPLAAANSASGARKIADVALRLKDHHMHVERLLGRPAHRFDHHRPDRDIWHEATVHDVNMDPVGARRIDGANLRGEIAEIRLQN